MNDLDQKLYDAISNADIQGVKNALSDGANVDAIARDFMGFPIWLYQMEIHDSNPNMFPLYNAIWGVLISQSKSLLTPCAVNKRMPNFNRVLSLNNTEGAAIVVLSAAFRTGGRIRIDIPEIFSILGDDKNPKHVARLDRREKILEIHKVVSERINNPFTEQEKKLHDALSGKNKRYWREPLAFPLLDLLPMPTEEFVKAREKLYHATHDILSFTKAMRETTSPLQTKGKLSAARSQSTAALERIKTLQEKNATSVWKLRLIK